MFYVGVGVVVRLWKEFFFVKDVFVLIVIDDVSNFCLVLSIVCYKDLLLILVYVLFVLFIFLLMVFFFLDCFFFIYFFEIEKVGVVWRGSEVIDLYKYVEFNFFS